MSLLLSFSKYHSKYISESFLADWGNGSSLGPWSKRKLSLLYFREHNDKCVSSDAATAQGSVRWHIEPQCLICKESLTGFPLKVSRLIRKVYAYGWSCNCGITAGVTRRQCWPPHWVLQHHQPLLPQWKMSMQSGWGCAVRMGLCRFGAETVKLFFLLFLKQILEVSVQLSVKKEQMGAVWSNSFEIWFTVWIWACLLWSGRGTTACHPTFSRFLKLGVLSVAWHAG